MKTIKFLTAIVAASLLMVGCDKNKNNDGEKTVEVEDIYIEGPEADLVVGDTFTIKAVISPDNATNKSIKWSSDNESVATVDKGEVTAVAAGSAVITAKAGGLEATCTVTVKEETPDVLTGTVWVCSSTNHNFPRRLEFKEEASRLFIDNNHYSANDVYTYNKPNLSFSDGDGYLWDEATGIVEGRKMTIDYVRTLMADDSELDRATCVYDRVE